LEKQLEKIDREEVVLLSLGSSRRDTNNKRSSILSEIDAALADYGTPSSLSLKTDTNNGTDALLERNRQVLSFEAALDRDVANLQNWVDGNGCIAREETAYLARAEDLLSVISPDDNAVMWLRALVEDSRVYFRERFGQVRNPRFALLRDVKHSTAFSAWHLRRPECAHISPVIYNTGSPDPDDTIHHCPTFDSRHYLQLHRQPDSQAGCDHSRYCRFSCNIIWLNQNENC